MYNNFPRLSKILNMIMMMTSVTQVWWHGKINNGCNDDECGGDACVCYSFEWDLNHQYHSSIIACTSLPL
jgi:hypothetical protein